MDGVFLWFNVFETYSEVMHASDVGQTEKLSKAISFQSWFPSIFGQSSNCHWLENRPFKWRRLCNNSFGKSLGNFRKNIGVCGGPITLTYKGQQTTLRPWDPSRCLDAQSISWRFRAINTLSILSRKDVRRSLEKGPCAHFATKMGRFRGLPLQV